MSDGKTVFISAKSDDYARATVVYEYLKANNVEAFFYTRSGREIGNANYTDEINKGLERAHHLVLVTSLRKNAEAEWVKHEWSTFLNEKLSGRKTGNLVTVVDRVTPAELPMALRQYEVIQLKDI